MNTKFNIGDIVKTPISLFKIHRIVTDKSGILYYGKNKEGNHDSAVEEMCELVFTNDVNRVIIIEERDES